MTSRPDSAGEHLPPHVMVLFGATGDLAARKRCPGAPAVVTDLCAPAITGAFDAVVARGVLNDLLTDDEREGALDVERRTHRGGGTP